MDKQAFLANYLNNASPTGFETAGQKIWLEYVKPYIDEYIVDTYGSVAGIINPGAPYKVVIEAHADEISWFVNYITDDGYIYVRRNGGSDALIAPSMRVNIHTRKGIVKGIFGWPAIHVRNVEKDEVPTLKNIFIDCGCKNKEEVLNKGVHVGSVVTFDNDFTTLNDRFYVGRALDNRIGGYMIAQVARLLKENNNQLDYSLYIVNAVQEEIGLRGAEMIARRINPDVAIITDVCHDTHSPMYKKVEQGDQACGKGPVLTYGPAVQNNVLNMLIDVAEQKEIPFQRASASRSTGTDTDAFAYSNAGVASALVSLPLKYMHTTVETVHQDDVENVIRLIYEFLVQLKGGHDFRYFT
ncbi:M42 family metallopeptidase [Rhodocytophaga rosea]|uniref:M42 family metallopeptidase n=1 Tax=Rhodocytophaga rosea TaxID=2704465 RepID=A0A6C0GT10_9BACT|nr:M42 family metallopeptidase [Rhodocytophaga rosea]QHT70582.1 M42 family metallopeptidase [Rhodocytophaga rosea]